MNRSTAERIAVNNGLAQAWEVAYLDDSDLAILSNIAHSSTNVSGSKNGLKLVVTCLALIVFFAVVQPIANTVLAGLLDYTGLLGVAGLTIIPFILVCIFTFRK